MNNLINFNSGLNNVLDELFNNDLTNAMGSDAASNIPAVNIAESADDFKIELAAPGLEKEDFNLNLEKDRLTISVKKESKAEKVAGEKITRKEFNYTSFSRSFNLPKDVDKKAIGAQYENGVLEITLPKKEEAKELPARVIEVK